MVDDGLATRATMWAAVAAIRRQRPARVVGAVPVGAASTCQQLQQPARVPTKAIAWTVGTRASATPNQSPRAADPRPEPGLTPPGGPGTDSFRNGDPAAPVGYKGWLASLP
jgi:hypothetical protein